ncbi:VOC family protein [Ancylobacter radicis]|uniref:VOC family protein n=1 Tax=Ancylobacter radicis TaxID=2836179 RepID=A0ABS5R261_9HYPH|nr:VOC family protein [Ancylobacter radicis]MBS9475750.1 VOC family protein [Ancylobacter radicis]
MSIIGGQAVGQFGLALIVQDVGAAADFYRDVFGAQEVARHFAPNPLDLPGPEPVAAELRLSGIHLMVTRENPRWREAPRPDWPRSPRAAGAASAYSVIYVADVAAVFARACAAGAQPSRPGDAPEEGYWGDRMIQIHDPFGHVWRLLERIEEVEAAALGPRLAAQIAAYRQARDAPTARPAEA